MCFGFVSGKSAVRFHTIITRDKSNFGGQGPTLRTFTNVTSLCDVRLIFKDL